MIGDVVGAPGLEALETLLPQIREKADFITVNGENSAGGFGLTEETLKRLLAAGADVITTGNHVWEKRDFLPFLDTHAVLRPANYPLGTAGKGMAVIEKNGFTWAVINLQGRDFLSAIDCPFRTFDNLANGIAETASKRQAGTAPIILVDFHAESTREKEALAYYVDGRVSLVAGTHTHVQTADERILPGGSGYITDLGMTGITSSIIGMDPATCLQRARKQVLYRMEIAEKTGDKNQKAELQGVIAEIDPATGKAVSIKRIDLF